MSSQHNHSRVPPQQQQQQQPHENPPLPWAPGSYILRSSVKDDSLVRGFTTQLQDVTSRVKGQRFASDHSELIKSLGQALYLASTRMSGVQTIGEEYTDLVSVNSTTVRPLGPARRLVVNILQVLLPHLLRRVCLRFWPTQNPTDLIEHVRRVHLCLFFLSSFYYHISHRLASVRFVAMRSTQAGDQSTDDFRFLGLLLALEYTVRGFRALKNRGTTAAPTAAVAPGVVGGNTAAREDSEAPDDHEEEEDEAKGRCTLCLSARRNPTATSCGHIFCWDCVTHWCKSSTSSAQPLCPLCRQSMTTASLVPLTGYVCRSNAET